MAKSAVALTVLAFLLAVLSGGAVAGYVDLWVEETSGPSQDLNGVYSVLAEKAWAVGNNGVVLRRDQSPSWQSVSLGVSGFTQSDWHFHGVYFGSKNLGWIVGEKRAGGR